MSYYLLQNKDGTYWRGFQSGAYTKNLESVSDQKLALWFSSKAEAEDYARSWGLNYQAIPVDKASSK